MSDGAGTGSTAAQDRRPPRAVTPAYLERAALAHLERYASSAVQLRRALARKVERRCRLRGEDPAPFLALIDGVVARAASTGLVDDARFAEGRTATLRRRGASSRLIGARLKAKGVSGDAIQAALANDPAGEEAAAYALARRRRIGPYRAGDRRAFRDKDLAAFARAGFRYDLAKRVIDGELPQECGGG